MKILVTGGSGFLGSHVADALTEAGHEVLLLDIKPSQYKCDAQEMVICDILDKEKLLHASKHVDYIYHFGAIADIDEANVDAEKTIMTNIIGTTNIIEACLENAVKKLIFASSIYVHSDMGGFYAATKKCCENIIEKYSQEKGLKFTILRYGSLYGSRANRKNGVYKIVDDMVHAKEKFVYNGTGDEVREFVHISDASKISVQCIGSTFDNKVFVLTGLERYKMNDFILMVKEILQKDIDICFTDKPSLLHYTLTPYAYSARLGEKVVSNPYIDMGQGLIELIHEIYTKEHYETL